MKTTFLCAIILVLGGIAAICVYARAENQQSAEADVRGLSDEEEVRAFLNTDPKAMADMVGRFRRDEPSQ